MALPPALQPAPRRPRAAVTRRGLGLRRRGALVVLALGLAGCDATLPWTAGHLPDPGTLTVASDAVSVRAKLGAASPAPVTVPIGISSYAYLRVGRLGAAVADATLAEGRGGPEVTITFPPPAAPPGERTGTVTVTACHDPACTAPLEGSPRTIAVRYTVDAALVASPGTQGLQVVPIP